MTVPVCVPAGRPRGSSVTVSVDGARPPSALREIHGWSELASQPSVPPAEFVMDRSNCFLPSFWSAVAVIDGGATLSPGWAISNSTGTSTGPFVASGAENTTVSR